MEKHISKVTEFLDRTTKSLDADMLFWLKQQFEANKSNYLQNTIQNLKISLVLDANIAISTIQRYADGETSILFHLHGNPMFTIIAPPKIEEEVINFINNPEQSEDRKKLRAGWRKLKKTILIQDVTDKKILDAALRLSEKRDPKDLQYVALYIETNSTAILTDDHDFDDFSVRQFNISKLDKVVGTFHRGVYSFFIFNDALPLILDFSLKVLTFIIKNVLELFSLLLSIITSIVTKSFEKLFELFSKIPKGAQSAIGSALLVGGLIFLVILAYRDDIRAKVSNAMRSAAKKVKHLLEKLLDWIRKAFDLLTYYAKKASPYTIASLNGLVEIQKHIDAISEELKTLNTNPANFI